MRNSKGNGEAGEIPKASEAQTERLIAKADQLIVAMEAIANQSGIKVAALEVRQKKQRRFVAGLAAAFVLIFGLTIAIILVGLGVQHQADEIANVQEKTTAEVLCPLYQQFINADTPRARQAAEAAGQDLKVRDHAFKVIRDGYRALECSSTTVITK